MNILFIGDVVGKGGRKAVIDLAPKLRSEYDCAFCIVNGENMAGGGGITAKCVNAMSHARVDVITGGDHMWDQKDFVTEIEDYPHVLRPANVSSSQPGKGYNVFHAANRKKVGVISLQGRSLMAKVADNPFDAADRAVKELSQVTPLIVVDMHAETTSEKTAMARFLDGRVSAVLGTHTHVPTADAGILPNGTAFQCDVGMVGSRESVLGRAIEPVVHHFATGMPARFSVVESEIRLHATLVEVDENSGQTLSIRPLYRDWD